MAAQWAMPYPLEKMFEHLDLDIARGFTPRRTRAKNPENAVQHPPVIDPFHTPWLVRQKRLYDRPLKVAKIVAHDPTPTVWKLESHRPVTALIFYGFTA